MDNVKGKTGFGWIELADVAADPTDTDTSRGALAVVGTTLKFWNKSAWITVDTASTGSFLDLTDSPANYTSAGNKILKVNNAGNAVEFVELSGDVTINASGVSTIGSEKVLTAMIKDGDVTLAKLESLADANIVVGNGATPSRPTAVAVTGDVHISNTGVTTIQTDAVETAMIEDGAVTSDKLAAGAGLAALFTSGNGANISYTKEANTDNGTSSTVLAVDETTERTALVMVHVDETFDNGDDGSQPTFELKIQDGAVFAATSDFTGATAGTVKVYGVSVTQSKEIEITAVPAGVASDGNQAGGITVTVLAVPTD